MKVMTVLQARVPPADWATLVDSYQAAVRHLPEQMIESFLLQNKEDPNLWTALGLWSSREAFKEYQSSVEIPAGIMIFRSAGVEPTMVLHEVAANGIGAAAKKP
jgi:heme-degrading monooxygenase HmoA